MNKIKQIILLCCSSFLFATEIQIPIDKAKEVSVNQLQNEIKKKRENKNSVNKQIEKLFGDSEHSNSVASNSISPLTKANNKYIKTNKIKLKNYVGVTYNKKLEWFSILGHGPIAFENFKKKYHISAFMENKFLNSTGNSLAIMYNAFLYDYKYKKPNIAENFYILFPKKIINNHKFSIVDRKLRFADYLIRTGRPLAIFNYLNKVECMSTIKWMGICMYYLGVAEYFRTGDNKNNYLMVARPYVKKARLLYNMK